LRLYSACFIKTDYWTLLTTQILLPVAFPVLLLSIAVIVVLFNRCKDQDYFEKLRRRLDSSPFERALSVYIFLLTGMYTFISSSSFSPFRCYPQADGTYTLIPDSTQDCYGQEWKKHIWIIAIGLLQIILIPIALIVILSQYKKNRYNNFYDWRYGLLFRSYKEEYFFWEVVIMLRKTLFVFLVDASNAFTTSLRIFFILLFLITNFVAESILRPYKQQGIRTLASLS
jgi:hypothetical protein